MMSESVKYPNVTVQLTEQDGNAVYIIARVRTALRRAGVSPVEVDAYAFEAMSGDYQGLLATTMRWVNVE